MFSFSQLSAPVVQAPMAGGPSCPALAAAVSEAGGLGFLAAGYLTPEDLQGQVMEVRAATRRPFGVNVFVPESVASARADLVGFDAALAPWRARLEVPSAEIPAYSDDHYGAKLELLLEDPVPVVSFTFGLPEREVVRALQAAGSWVALSVSSVEEAERAVALAPDALVVQSHEAGGHRATLDQRAPLGTEPLLELLAAVRASVRLPVVAAGGLATADAVREVLDAGAAAVQVGTAFAVAEEAGTSGVHRQALLQAGAPDGSGGTVPSQTVVTRVFSGRPARALSNEFTRDLGPRAVAGYPQVHYLTAPLRAAAKAAGDPEAVNLWAGTGVAEVREGSAAEVLARLLA